MTSENESNQEPDNASEVTVDVKAIGAILCDNLQDLAISAYPIMDHCKMPKIIVGGHFSPDGDSENITGAFVSGIFLVDPKRHDEFLEKLKDLFNEYKLFDKHGEDVVVRFDLPVRTDGNLPDNP